jgi:hypothetical protein
MSWEILCLTQPSRAPFLSQLRMVLAPQLRPGVSFRIQADDGSGIGEQRHRMKMESTADYVSMIDDDDLPSANFVSEILPLLNGVDYIGFCMFCYDIGADCETRRRHVVHSLAYSDWTEDENCYYRDISHFNPMRRELSISIPMTGSGDEDYRWSCGLRGKVKTQHFIDKFLIHYFNRHPKNDADDWRNPDRLTILESIGRAL